jgi:hypothetical protein
MNEYKLKYLYGLTSDDFDLKNETKNIGSWVGKLESPIEPIEFNGGENGYLIRMNVGLKDGSRTSSPNIITMVADNEIGQYAIKSYSIGDELFVKGRIDEMIGHPWIRKYIKVLRIEESSSKEPLFGNLIELNGVISYIQYDEMKDATGKKCVDPITGAVIPVLGHSKKPINKIRLGPNGIAKIRFHICINVGGKIVEVRCNASGENAFLMQDKFYVGDSIKCMGAVRCGYKNINRPIYTINAWSIFSRHSNEKISEH